MYYCLICLKVVGYDNNTGSYHCWMFVRMADMRPANSRCSFILFITESLKSPRMSRLNYLFAKYSSIKKIIWMASLASAWKLMKKVEMKRPNKKTMNITKMEFPP